MICLTYRTPAQNLINMAVGNPKVMKAITEQLNWIIKENGWSFHLVALIEYFTEDRKYFWELTTLTPTVESSGLYFNNLRPTVPKGTSVFEQNEIFEVFRNRGYCYA